MFTDDLLRALPKSDLHCHLDGSLRLESLIEMARERNVKLPSDTAEGLMELVFKDQYRDLPEYLHGFAYTCAVLQDVDALERAAYELAQDCLAEGVCYLEVRFAPQLHVGNGNSVPDVLQVVLLSSLVVANTPPRLATEPVVGGAAAALVCRVVN